MARTRNVAVGNRLTKQQEIFVNELVKGKTQRQALLAAYPHRANWKENSLDCAASLLASNKKVKQRYEELLAEIRQSEQEQTKWTREQAITTLRYVIDKNREDLERIQSAAEEELELLATAAAENPHRASELILEAVRKRKAKRMSNVHNTGIVSAVAELNKMQGFNEETINLNGTVVFEGEDKLID